MSSVIVYTLYVLHSMSFQCYHTSLSIIEKRYFKKFFPHTAFTEKNVFIIIHTYTYFFTLLLTESPEKIGFHKYIYILLLE
jgi:hypothetical protein